MEAPLTQGPPPREERPPAFRCHFFPRTRDGRLGLLAFVVLFVLVEPPVLFVVANRIRPVLLGIPFLYLYLTCIYAGLTIVLLWIRRRGV